MLTTCQRLLQFSGRLFCCEQNQKFNPFPSHEGSGADDDGDDDDDSGDDDDNDEDRPFVACRKIFMHSARLWHRMGDVS